MMAGWLGQSSERPNARPLENLPMASSRPSSARRTGWTRVTHLMLHERSWLQAFARSGAPSEVAGVVVPVLSFLLAVEEERPRDFDPNSLSARLCWRRVPWSSGALSMGPCYCLWKIFIGRTRPRRNSFATLSNNWPSGPDDADLATPGRISASCRTGFAKHHPACAAFLRGI